MPCFSFSAPSISPEQERREREELGAQYQQIQDEMRGRAAPAHLKSQDFQCSLEDIQAEIAKMPDSEKKYFLQAMECAPNLVETESNHLHYQSNCQSRKEVASRIAAYWKLRHQVFGESNAFLPISSKQTHEASNFVKVLGTDRANRHVLLFDLKEKLKSKTSRSAVLRHLFIVLHTLSKDEKARKYGFVVIESMFGFDLYNDFDRLLTKTKMSLLRDCFPIQLKCFHLCGGTGEKWVVDLVVPVIKHIAGKSIRLRMVCHTASSHKIASILDEHYSIDSWTLPLAIGGRHRTEPVAKKASAETGLNIPSKVHATSITYHPRFAQKRPISSSMMLKGTLAENWRLKNGLDCRPETQRS